MNNKKMNINEIMDHLAEFRRKRKEKNKEKIRWRKKQPSRITESKEKKQLETKILNNHH